MLDDPTWGDIYAPRGYLAVEGDFIQRTAYGHTLEKIAKHGGRVFYEGPMAESMIDTIQAQGGIMTLDDVR